MSFTRESINNPLVTMDKAGLAFVDGVSTPFSITIASSTINLNASGKRSLPAHMWVARYGTTYRFLKRAKLAAATATGSPTTTFSQPVNVFDVGDIIYPVHPYGTITLSLTWDADDTIAVSVGGRSVTYTPGSAVLATGAATLATLINANPIHSQLVVAIASGAVVYLFGKDGRTAHALAVTATTTGDGDAAASAATLTLPTATAIGTISAINQTTGVITLSGNAGVAFPIGTPVGVVHDELLGPLQGSIDLSSVDRYNVAPIYKCHGYYENAFAYIDEQIKFEVRDRIPIAVKF